MYSGNPGHMHVYACTLLIKKCYQWFIDKDSLIFPIDLQISSETSHEVPNQFDISWGRQKTLCGLQHNI